MFKHCINWLFENHCLLCHAKSDTPHTLCSFCLNDFPIIKESCYQCGIPFPLDKETPLCGKCLTHPPDFDKTTSLFYYEPPITQLILQLKFEGHLINARLFGELLIQKMWEEKTRPDCLLPVPLHPTRLKERGFNQAIEIARPIAKQYQLPLDTHSIQRVKATLPQATLSAKERLKNVQNAFESRCSLKGLHIAVIEDVITTGYTLQVLSATLKRAGAQRVDLWSIARRLKPL